MGTIEQGQQYHEAVGTIEHGQQYLEQMETLLVVMSDLNVVYQDISSKVTAVEEQEKATNNKISLLSEKLKENIEIIQETVSSVEKMEGRYGIDELSGILQENNRKLTESVTTCSEKIRELTGKTKESIDISEESRLMLQNMIQIKSVIEQIIETEQGLKEQLGQLQEFNHLSYYVDEIKQNLTTCKEIRDELLHFSTGSQEEGIEGYLERVKSSLLECVSIKEKLGAEDLTLDKITDKIRILKEEYQQYRVVKQELASVKTDQLNQEFETMNENLQVAKQLNNTLKELKRFGFLTELSQTTAQMNQNITNYATLTQKLKKEKEAEQRGIAEGSTIMDLFIKKGFSLPIEVRKKEEEDIFLVNSIQAFEKGCLAIGTLLKKDGTKDMQFKALASSKGWVSAY